MRTRNGKLGTLGMLGMMMVAAIAVACSDRGPTALSSHVSEMETVLPGSGTISGQVISTVRRFDGANLLGSVMLVDTGSYEGAITGGRVQARGVSRSGSFDLTVAVSGVSAVATETTHERRWSAKSVAPEGAPGFGVRSATFVAQGDAPASEVTYSRGAEVVARVATAWVKVQGGWLMQSQTLTAFRDGRPTSSVETVILDRRITVGSTALSARGVASPDAVATGASLRGGAEGVASASGDCQSEFDAMFDALDRFSFASASMLACLAGPWACFGASMAVLISARGVDVADARLNRCLGGEL